MAARARFIARRRWSSKFRPARKRKPLHWLATEKGQFDAKTTEALVQLKAALEAEKDVVILFGADIQGAAIRDLVSFSARLGGKTKFMALGDYANSRGAADMGVLPDRLPGYAPLIGCVPNALASANSGAARSPPAPGLTARAMMEAAVAGKLKALYVVGANPLKTFGVAQPDRLGRARTARRARHVPDRNGAARRRRTARRIHRTKKTAR